MHRISELLTAQGLAGSHIVRLRFQRHPRLPELRSQPTGYSLHANIGIIWEMHFYIMERRALGWLRWDMKMLEPHLNQSHQPGHWLWTAPLASVNSTVLKDSELKGQVSNALQCGSHN